MKVCPRSGLPCECPFIEMISNCVEVPHWGIEAEPMLGVKVAPLLDKNFDEYGQGDDPALGWQ